VSSTADLSYSDIENLWITNGGNPSSAPIAAAIAMAESSGNPLASNPSGATGLWQILESAHPQWSVQQLQNPNTNAQAAIAISNNGSNWNPWQTYTENVYQKYLQAGSATPNTAGGTVTTNLTCTFPTISVFGSTICPDGAVGVLATGLGLLLMVSGTIICVAFALSKTGAGKAAKDAMIAVGGPYTKIAGMVT
jgi:Lysozyme like domain